MECVLWGGQFVCGGKSAHLSNGRREYSDGSYAEGEFTTAPGGDTTCLLKGVEFQTYGVNDWVKDTGIFRFFDDLPRKTSFLCEGKSERRDGHIKEGVFRSRGKEWMNTALYKGIVTFPDGSEWEGVFTDMKMIGQKQLEWGKANIFSETFEGVVRDAQKGKEMRGTWKCFNDGDNLTLGNRLD